MQGVERLIAYQIFSSGSADVFPRLFPLWSFRWLGVVVVVSFDGRSRDVGIEQDFLCRIK